MTEKTKHVARTLSSARKTQRTSRSGPKTARPEGSKSARRGKRAERRAIMVLGMHRSGTSAIAKLLGICGARLPKHPLAASKLNAKGFFESAPIYQLHEEIFEEMGTSWDELAPLDDSWLASPIAGPYVERMASLVEDEFEDSQLILLKDPRMCRLVPFWREVLSVLEIEPCFVLPIRNPLEVAASLKEAQGIPELKGLLLWLQYFLQAERDSRGAPRAFLTYDHLLKDWRAVIKGVSRDLDLSFPRLSRRAAAEGDDFLTVSLRNHTEPLSDYADREDVVSWVKETYAWSQRAAVKKPTSFRRLDQIWAAYCIAEAAFGPVVAHSQLNGERRQQEARALLSEVTELKAEIGEMQLQVVPREEIGQLQDKFQAQAHAKEKQVADLVECIKLMLSWIASSTVGGQAAHERLDSLLQALNSAEAGSISELASQGLQRFEQSEMLRLQRETQTRASEMDTLASELRRAERRLEEQQRAQNDRIAAQGDELGEQARRIEDQSRQLGEQGAQIERQAHQIAEQGQERERQAQQIAEQVQVIERQAQQIAEQVQGTQRQAQQIAEQAEVIEAQAQQITAEEADRSDRNERIVALDGQLATVNERLLAREAELQTQSDRLAEQDRQLASAQERAGAQSSTIESLQSAEAVRGERVSQLEAEALRLQTQVDETDSRLRDADQRHEQLDIELQALRSRLEERDASLHAKTEQADLLLAARDQSQARLEASVSELRELGAKHSELEAEVERLAEENSLALGEIQRLHGIATRVRRQAAEGALSNASASPAPGQDPGPSPDPSPDQAPSPPGPDVQG